MIPATLEFRTAPSPAKLEQLLRARSISPARLQAKLRERLGERSPSEQQLRRWRYGRSDIQRKNAIRVLWAVRELADDPTISIEDVFDFDPNNPANWSD